MASLKPQPAKIVRSAGVCSMSGKDDVSFIYFRMGSGFPFGRQGMTRLSVILLTGWGLCSSLPDSVFDRGFIISVNVDALVCRRDLIKLSSKSLNTAAC